MDLQPYDSFRQISDMMRREVERVFSEFPFGLGNMQGFGGFRLDVYETANEVVATCDIPGLEKKDDLVIDIDYNRLSISGSVNNMSDLEEGNTYKKERYVGRFQRVVSLPTPVSNEGVKATYKKGVLEVRMPKLVVDSKKQIDIDFS